MKRLTMISMAALVLLAVSCKKDKQQEIENAGSGFRATTENHAGDSKTHLENAAVNWNSGDAIMVTSGANVPKRFTTTSTEGTATFTAAESLPINFYQGSYTAYYPADAFSGSTLNLGGTQNAVFDGQQAYVPTFGNGANPMMASSSTTNLAFKNICGLLQLQLWSQAACTVKSITITTESDNLCGSGTVAWNSGEPTLNITTGNNSVTFDCGTGVVLSITSDSPTLFNIVLPAGTLNGGFTVEVTNSNNEKWTKQAPASENNQIVRSRVLQMPAIKVECKPNIPEGALPGVFTINEDGRQVYFSKGNLYYNGEEGSKFNSNLSAGWNFYDKQTDFCNVSSVSANNEISLFTWGYGTWSKEYTNYNYETSDVITDWGTQIGDGNWRTLTSDQWNYLYNVRGGTGYPRFARARIKVSSTNTNIYGLLIFPDGYSGRTSGNGISDLNKTDSGGAYPTSSMTESEWKDLEDLGVVFLPAAGWRNKAITVSKPNSKGYYSSSDPLGMDDCKQFTFDNANINTSSNKRYLSRSVRLVKDVPAN